MLVLATLDKLDLQGGLEWVDRETALNTRWEAMNGLKILRSC